VSPVALARFGLPVRPTTVPRNTVYRFRVPADRDLADLVHRLTERDVELLEVRRCAEPRRRPRRSDDRPEVCETARCDDVVVPFRRGGGGRRPRHPLPGSDEHPPGGGWAG
jgi:hypothetical protein